MLIFLFAYFHVRAKQKNLGLNEQEIVSICTYIACTRRNNLKRKRKLVSGTYANLFFLLFSHFFSLSSSGIIKRERFFSPCCLQLSERITQDKKVQKTLNKMVIAKHPEKFQVFFCCCSLL